MKNQAFLLLQLLSLFMFSAAHSATYDWIDWQTKNVAAGTMAGTITRPDGETIQVDYSGEIAFAQTGVAGETNYWIPDMPYKSTLVSNAPPTADVVAVTGNRGRTQTIRFSRPVKDPVMAFVSLGAPFIPVNCNFSVPFEIISFGRGFWGDGRFERAGFKKLLGYEGHGVIRFEGVFTEISWTYEGSEYWHGFSFGVSDAYLESPSAIAAYINQGQPQRSMIQGIGMTFDRDVRSVLQSSHLKARNLATGQLHDLSGATLVHDPRNFSATWMLNKDPQVLLPDGNYIAWLETDRLVGPDLFGKYSADRVSIDDFTFGFHQLAGDSDGDRDVDFKDASVLRDTWQKSFGQPPFRNQLDFDLNDSVTDPDHNKVLATYFTTLAEAPGLHAYLRTDTGTSQTDNRSSLYDVAVGIVGYSKFATLEARLDERAFVNVTAQIVSANKAILPQATMNTLAGGTVSIGTHRLELRALNATGAVVASEAMDFEYLGASNYAPYFTSTAPKAIKLDDYVGGVANDVLFTLPGPPGASVQTIFRWTIRSAAYNNEFGVYAVEDQDGRVSGLLPANPGYSAVALSATNSTRVFASGQGAGAVSTVTLKAGQIYGFYIIQNSTSNSLRLNNPNNLITGSPLAFLSFEEANPDDIDHLIATPLPDGKTQFAWEDLTGVGDKTNPGNFRDVVYTIDNELLSGGRSPVGYDAVAIDPENAAVTYHLVNNPDGSAPPLNASVGLSTGKFSWIPELSGSYTFTLEARDPSGNAGRQTFTLDVLDRDLPPTIQILAANAFPNINEAVSLQVVAQDDIGITQRTLAIDGTPVTLNAQGYYTTTYTTKGVRELLATATDTAGQTTQTKLQLVVRDPADPDPPGGGGSTGPGTGPYPNVIITSPATDSTLTYLTQIRGTVDPNGGTLRDWALDYAPAELVDMQSLGTGTFWTRIASGTTAQTDAVLGTLDTTMLRNDSYVVRLIAYNTSGRGYVIPAIYHVSGDAKLGNFRLDFTDLQIPLAGIPITITRSYDTLEAKRVGDFGYGWKLGVQDGDIRETTPGVGGLFTANPYRHGTRVYVTTPEGRRIGFTFQPEFAAGSLFGSVYRAKFVPDPGVYEKLSVPEGDQGFLSVGSDGTARLFLFGFGWNPDEFIVTRPDGTRFTYTQTEGLKKAVDPASNQLTFTHDGITHTSGVSIQFIRDAQGRITEIRDPDGRSIRYTYNAAGDLISVTDRLTNITQFTYRATPAHYLEDVIDPLGRRAQRTEYGPDGRVVAVIDAQGNRIEQSFDPASFTGTRTDARGNITTLVYDARGNLLEERKPEGGITRYEYADTANPDKETAIIDPRGNRTTFTYDSRGNKLTETDPLGTVTTYAYNALNKITSLQRRNATGTLQTSESATYDAAGNLTRITNAAGHHRDFVYDLQSRLISSTDFEGNVTSYDYTAGCPCGSPSKITYADGSTKLLEYNSLGQVTKVTDETGAITRSSYDANGRKISETDHDGKVTTFEYDANNNLLKRTDRLGRIAKFIYDEKNRLTREIKLLTNDSNDTNDVLLNYEYDADGHLTALIDPVGNRTEFSFDRDGRMTTRRDAAGAATTVSYDLAGNTSAIVDRNGRKRSFLYNERNQPTAERWHAPDDSILRTIAITYDDFGRRATIADPDSAYAWQYDSSSRITQVSNAGTPGLPAVTLFHSYDKDGRLTSVIDNAGVQVQTTHDVRGRSDRFIWTGGGISPASVDIDRNSRGQITSLKRFADSTFTNQVSRTTYDQIAPQGWVKQIQHKDGTGALYNAGTNFTYSYDFEGQVIGQSSQGNSTSYTYDPTGQLLTANHSAAAYPDEFYNYDKSGNRTSSHLHAAYTTGTANRLQSDGQYNYGYDAEGNMTTRTEIITGKVTTFTYDHRGRTTSIIERASAGGAVLDSQVFVYDALDRRITINSNGSVTNIVYHGENAWADYAAGGTVAARYLFASRIDSNLSAWTPTTGTKWYIADKLGSVRGLTDSNGAVSTNYSFDSFGKLLNGSGLLDGESNRFAFTSREFVNQGVHYYRSRCYSNAQGRFLGEDQDGFTAGDFNLYRYGLNQPTLFTDPTGRTVAVEYLGLLKSRHSEAAASVIGFGQGVFAAGMSVAAEVLALEPGESLSKAFSRAEKRVKVLGCMLKTMSGGAELLTPGVASIPKAFVSGSELLKIKIEIGSYKRNQGYVKNLGCLSVDLGSGSSLDAEGFTIEVGGFGGGAEFGLSLIKDFAGQK